MIRFGQQMLSVVKLRKVGEHLEFLWREEEAMKIFLVKSGGKRQLGKPRCKYIYNIKMCLQINRLDLYVSGYAEVAGCHKHTNEPSTK